MLLVIMSMVEEQMVKIEKLLDKVELLMKQEHLMVTLTFLELNKAVKQ